MDQHESPFAGGTPDESGSDDFRSDDFRTEDHRTDGFRAGQYGAAPSAAGREAEPYAPFDVGDDGVEPSHGVGSEIELAAGRTVAVFGERDRDRDAGRTGAAGNRDALEDSGSLTPFGVSTDDEGSAADSAAALGLAALGAGDGFTATPGVNEPLPVRTPMSGGFGTPAGRGQHPAGGGGFNAFGASASHGDGAQTAPGGGFDAFGAGTGAASERIPGAAAAPSFDGFAAGAGTGRSEPRALLPAPAADDSASSLFDSSKPVPRMTRPARDPLAPELGTPSGGNVRVPRIVAGGYLLTVNSVDGTEVVPCPPEERPTPVRRTPEERAAKMAAARPAPPPGPPAPEPPLLERDEERERLSRLLARGRSVRVTGASGAGRTALLDSVATACTDLAPEGVLRLSGYRRTASDVLQDLYALVYAGDGHRPGRDELAALLKDVGAVVVLDDLEFGGAALEEVLAAAPECAFLMSATPDVPAPAADSMVEEVFLSGLTRTACRDLLQLVAGRPLEEDERAWAADLWFESEGLPLRFVQAGVLLRQRDVLRLPPELPDWDDSVWENGSPTAGTDLALPDLSAFEKAADEPQAAPADPLATTEAPAVAAAGPLAARLPAGEVPLPSLAESAAPAELLASRLGESAREALAFAVALDGECPHPAHLPALVGDTHGDAALGELTSVGLAVPVASHFRLAAGVAQHLAAALTAEGELSEVQAHTAALHYAWWTGHPSVTPERAAAESEAIIAAMTACRDGGQPSAAVLLARTVAPAFAAALHWGAWERALRIGQEAARLSGEVAEEAYFHHELGVLALCTGGTDRARAELEASIALRGALADRQGTVVGRRTLALVVDQELAAGGGPSHAGAFELPPGESGAGPVVIGKPSGEPSGPSVRRLAVVGSRRNLIAAGTGVLLAAVVGTFVTLGATSGGDDAPNQVKPIESVEQGAPDTTQAPPADGTTASPPSTSPSTSTAASGPTGAASSAATTGAPASHPVGGVTSPPVAPTTPPPAGSTHTPTSRPTRPHPSGSATTTHSQSPTPSQSTPTPTDTATSPTGSPTTPATQPQSSTPMSGSPVSLPDSPSASPTG
ncbi:ATP-binding protein [Streptomyces sp. V4-01]|uniref:ATP-binding protein n=1 Tax=Actinacidiphila polyblastidii TaxID=3110430 RepID=A0ABU7P4U1_9ACTN|nr:ATP-binding protein [Streptomyces sp. V4-01]